MKTSIPIVGFAAFSGTGKTTLLIELIKLFSDKGYRIGCIKHAHHNFEIDYPEKDSFRLRKSGASQMLIASDKRVAKITELNSPKTFDECLSEINIDEVDYVFVEGFKKSGFKKIQLNRNVKNMQEGAVSIFDENILAVAEDKEFPTAFKNINLERLDINNINEIYEFIVKNASAFDYYLIK